MKPAALLLLCLLLANPCLAQSGHPLVETFAGFSYARADADDRDFNRNLYGWNGSLSVNANRKFGFTVDASGHYQDNIVARSRFFTLLAGPRFTARNENATTFAHILLGGTHQHESVNTLTDQFTFSANAFVIAIGGGVDLNVTPRFGVRVVQAEYLLTKFNNAASGNSIQHNARVGIGIVFKFAERND
ncbi:MAG: outer membrane beta-barrel protein [Blastocatellia bacterium]